MKNQLCYQNENKYRYKSHFKISQILFQYWKHRFTLIFKTKKLWLLVDEIEIKPIAPPIAH